MEGKKIYKSEVSRYREYLTKFCQGYGIDIGYGGDPIIPSAITVDIPYGAMAYCGDHPLNLGGDARKLPWFSSNTLDYVFSSHCLEDFESTREIMFEWLRVLKPGGKLVLLLPDQKRYEKICKENNIPLNEAHKIKEFGLAYMEKISNELNNITKVIFKKDFPEGYNFIIVLEKLIETYGCKGEKWTKRLFKNCRD